MRHLFHVSLSIICCILLLSNCNSDEAYLGNNEAIRVYVEFADGANRGMYNQETKKGGFLDEPYDATTAMVINWHKLPESIPNQNERLQYRQEYPRQSRWESAKGESYPFWFRDEMINRIVLKNLKPNSVYAFKVKQDGEIFRFRTMPSSLDDRSVKIVIASDHQSPKWNDFAHANAKMVALLKPDMFLALGDFVNCEGMVTATNAERWASYLDYLFNTSTGYFLYDTEIEGRIFSNIIIPHVAILGNHEVGDRNHIRWPTCVVAPEKDISYPRFTSANWMEHLFHFPFKSEGFYSEFRPDHPNINKDYVKPEYGHGGFGKLSFSDYLLLIALDNSQNWEGSPDVGLLDWQGNPITNKWPWFETHHSDVRQDLWLINLLEPKGSVPARDKYSYIIPVWHRGLFGSSRLNMSLKNRQLLEFWLPVLYRNGVKFFAEAHDHLFGRTIPMGIKSTLPKNTYLEKVYYKPNGWNLPINLSQDYIDDFFSVNCIKDNITHEIIGWEYKGNFITYEQSGMRSFGYGGWAAGRREIGSWGAGNAGWWFVDSLKGGCHFSGADSYHINLINLTKDELITEAYSSSQLSSLNKGERAIPIHRISWNRKLQTWSDQ
ncbi:calcineurin-like phosphoesterase [Bacteroidales bacterium 6E]|nr:calcineurin-like phosphoesterase [Bacteroidales bacterium 6E]